MISLYNHVLVYYVKMSVRCLIDSISATNVGLDLDQKHYYKGFLMKLSQTPK